MHIYGWLHMHDQLTWFQIVNILIEFENCIVYDALFMSKRDRVNSADIKK